MVMGNGCSLMNCLLRGCIDCRSCSGFDWCRRRNWVRSFWMELMDEYMWVLGLGSSGCSSVGLLLFVISCRVLVNCCEVVCMVVMIGRWVIFRVFRI